MKDSFDALMTLGAELPEAQRDLATGGVVPWAAMGVVWLGCIIYAYAIA